ncbi:hypothetical protein [Haloechinothrix salitolerans]|uniref:Scaffolding protein n=1 Tax=Haloechinothrix salitolerans TaxID=926830 RepID=A0ABW2CAQ4_9PSEU
MSAPVPNAPADGGAADAPPTPDPTTSAGPGGSHSGSNSEPNSGSNTGAEQGSPTTSPDVEALRTEVTEWRTKAEGAQQDIVDKIARALGITAGDEAPTVEQVTDQLTAAQREARERAVDLAVYRSADAAGADPDALLDSTGFRKRVADLDPAADGFADKVAAAITAAVKENPRLSAAPAAAPRSGGEITGGSPSGGDDLGSLSIEDYIKRTRKGRS